MTRSLSLLVPAVLACIAGPSLARSEIATAVSSLANQPELIEPRLIRSGDGLRLRFAAGFANPCLAGQGIEATRLDLGPAAGGGPLRLVLIEPSAGGPCPDLWRPTRSCFEVELPELPEGAVVLLEPAAPAPRPLVLEGAGATTLPPDPACRRITASPLLGGAAVPVALGAEVVQKPTPAAPGYVLAVDLAVPEACARAPLRASIIESRITAEAPVIDWLLLHAGPCSPGEPVVRRATLHHSVGVASPREVAILNSPGSAAEPFPRLRVLP